MSSGRKARSGTRPAALQDFRGPVQSAAISVRVFHSDHHVVPLPPGHRFPMGKYRLIREALLASGVLRADELIPAEPADPRVLLHVHTARWVEAVLENRLTEAEQRRLGFPWSPELVLRSLASVGGTCAAAVRALDDGIGGNLAGGTHHAFADHGEGFCVFNDIAVAIRALQAERRISRALVVDLDVHQGNGTAQIFESESTVFTFSMHGANNFPFHKTRSSRDVALEDGTGDEAYLAALAEHLPQVLQLADPEIVFYQAGVDPLADDSLGRLALTAEGLRRRDELVCRKAREWQLPIVLTLGGGYAQPIEKSIEAHIATYQVAREVFDF